MATSSSSSVPPPYTPVLSLSSSPEPEPAVPTRPSQRSKLKSEKRTEHQNCLTLADSEGWYIQPESRLAIRTGGGPSLNINNPHTRHSPSPNKTPTFQSQAARQVTASTRLESILSLPQPRLVPATQRARKGQYGLPTYGRSYSPPRLGTAAQTARPTGTRSPQTSREDHAPPLEHKNPAWKAVTSSSSLSFRLNLDRPHHIHRSPLLQRWLRSTLNPTARSTSFSRKSPRLTPHLTS